MRLKQAIKLLHALALTINKQRAAGKIKELAKEKINTQ